MTAPTATARASILGAVRSARPAAVARPDVQAAVAGFPALADLVGSFVDAARAAGARVVDGSRDGLADVIASVSEPGGRHVSASLASEREIAECSPHSFADTDVFVCEAVLGVAENGAVWLPLSRLRHRSAIFLATNVVVVLDRHAIVPHLHAAYASIDVAGDGFGVFVAGPSKTADIEQALVIGAHGAKSLTILLV